jgi:hypothetical protein
MTSDPELFDDKGSGKAWVKDLNLSVMASPHVQDSFFQFEFNEIEIEIDDFGLDL